MNPFLNPVTGLPFIKNFILDPGRLRRLNHKQMERYRDKVLRKAVKYAYTVPLYHKKYKKAGVHPDDIRGIKDITKLPFVTKKDLVENFPDGVIPVNYNKDNAYVASTSGSTGKPVSIYTDFSTMAKAFGTTVRNLQIYKLNWRKTRFVNIGTYLPGRIDMALEEGFYSELRAIFSSNRYLRINAFEPIKEIIKKLDTFKPDIIYTYPVTFQHLAFLKKKGYGKNIKPKLLVSGGYVLDEYTRNYAEEAFGCKMLNIYPSVESCADVAFECMHGTWHIQWDFFHVEAIDKNMELVSPGERGHIVITRMFGRGTPIIRYTGMDDWVTLSPIYKCNCGLCTPVIEGGVEGRIGTSVVLPDGRVFPSASFAIVSLVLKDLKTHKVKQFQIVQTKIDEIEILLVIDDDLRDVAPSVDLIFKKIKEAYEKKVGPDVKITVKEIKEIKSPPNKPAPLVVSRLKPEDRDKFIL